MSHWIEEEAETAARRKAEENAHFERKKYERETLTRQARDSFDALVSAVKADIDKFNELFPGFDKRLKFLAMAGAMGFLVERAYDPAFTLKVRFDGTKPAIFYEMAAPAYPNGAPYKKTGELRIELQHSLRWILSESGIATSPEAAAQKLLRPAVSGYFAP